MDYYFAYGSNLSSVRQQERGLGLEFVCVGYLESHKLCFPRFSVSNRCGVASIRPDESSRVYGAVYIATPQDLKALDVVEGFRGEGIQSAYRRINVRIVGLNDSHYPCHTYVADIAHDKHYNPSPEYLQFILNGLSELLGFGLPEEYLETVRSAALGK